MCYNDNYFLKHPHAGGLYSKVGIIVEGILETGVLVVVGIPDESNPLEMWCPLDSRFM